MHKLEEVKYPSVAAAQDALQNYTTFTLVRHPLERITSAYTNKMLEMKKKTMRNYVRKRRLIMRLYGNYTKESITSSREVYPTLAEFVAMLTDPHSRLAETDRHFQREELRCMPCDFKFDYILKLETLNQDLAWFIPQVWIAAL